MPVNDLVSMMINYCQFMFEEGHLSYRYIPLPGYLLLDLNNEITIKLDNMHAHFQDTEVRECWNLGNPQNSGLTKQTREVRETSKTIEKRETIASIVCLSFRL